MFRCLQANHTRLKHELLMQGGTTTVGPQFHVSKRGAVPRHQDFRINTPAPLSPRQLQAAEARFEAERLSALGVDIFAPYDSDDSDEAAEGGRGATSQWIRNLSRAASRAASREPSRQASATASMDVGVAPQVCNARAEFSEIDVFSCDRRTRASPKRPQFSSVSTLRFYSCNHMQEMPPVLPA